MLADHVVSLNWVCWSVSWLHHVLCANALNLDVDLHRMHVWVMEW